MLKCRQLALPRLRQGEGLREAPQQPAVGSEDMEWFMEANSSADPVTSSTPREPGRLDMLAQMVGQLAETVEALTLQNQESFIKKYFITLAGITLQFPRPLRINATRNPKYYADNSSISLSITLTINVIVLVICNHYNLRSH